MMSSPSGWLSSQCLRFGRPTGLLLALTFLAVPCDSARGDDWPQWLGPQRDGVWRETGIVTSFPKAGLPVRWRTTIGAGYAGPAVANGRVYVIDRFVAEAGSVPDDPFARGKIPGAERVLCLNETDGEIVWKHEYDCTYTISYPAGPRATPTVHEGKVYTLGAEGHLFCFDAEKGDVLWSRDLKKDYKIDAPMWGFSAHPLVDGQKLICMVGGAGSTVVAFDKDSGKELWRALSAERGPGYCPPSIQTAGGKRQLIVWHTASVNGLNPENGDVYWSQPIEAGFGMSIAAPQRSGDLLFVTSYPDKSLLLRLDDEKPAAEPVWTGTNRTSVYPAMATPFVEDGYAYSPCGNGEFRCIELKTGKRVWSTFEPTTGRRPARWANAFVIKHEDRFFLPNEKGELIIANLSPQGYEEISRTQLLEPTGTAGGRELVWSHPAFANRSIYARNDKEIVCYSLAVEAP